MRRMSQAQCIILSGLLGCVSATAATPLSLNDFGGYWTGIGQVTLTNGNVERLKCVATYKVEGEQLRQNLRCASPGQTVNSSAELRIKAGDVTGTWEEKTYAVVGAVTGRLTADGFLLAITGPAFSATMSLTGSACKQAISIVPQGLEVTQIGIGLGKC